MPVIIMIAAMFIAFVILTIVSERMGFRRSQSLIQSAVTVMFVMAISIFSTSPTEKDTRRINDKTGNVTPNLYCPPTNNGDYLADCSVVDTKRISSNPNRVDFDFHGEVIKNKKTGDLYVGVASNKLKGKDTDGPRLLPEEVRIEYVKISDLPKIFDNDTDINSVADSSISPGDWEHFASVYGFKRGTKAPIMNVIPQ